MVFLAFFGKQRTAVRAKPGRRMTVPLIALAVLSTVSGFVELPPLFGDFRPFSEFLLPVLPPLVVRDEGGSTELLLLLITEALQISGILLAYFLFLRRPASAEHLRVHPAVGAAHAFWLSGWGFDWLYDRLLIRPFVRVSELARDDVIDRVYAGTGALVAGLHGAAARTQTGSVRWYAAGIALGAVIILGIVLLS